VTEESSDEREGIGRPRGIFLGKRETKTVDQREMPRQAPLKNFGHPPGTLFGATKSAGLEEEPESYEREREEPRSRPLGGTTQTEKVPKWSTEGKF